MHVEPAVLQQIVSELDLLVPEQSKTLGVALERLSKDHGPALRTDRGALVLDEAFAANYSHTADAALSLVERRMKDYDTPWTPSTQEDIDTALRNWLSDYSKIAQRERMRFSNATLTASIVEAQQLVGRRVTARLKGLVLQQEKRKLPLAALLSAPRYDGVRANWEAAHGALSELPPRDADATGKAIDAVEALARIVTGQPTDTLGACIKTLEQRTPDAAARHLLGVLKSLWNFTNASPDVRHGGGAGEPLTPAQASVAIGVAENGLRLLLSYDV